MSRCLRDRLYIGVAPEKLSLVRLDGLRTRQVLDCQTYSLGEGDVIAGAMTRLFDELALPRWRRTRVCIIVSDLLARYFISPIPLGARLVNDLEAAARLRFEDIYGDDPERWKILIDASPWTSNHMGCAIPKALVEGLHKACSNSALSVDAIQPFGIAEYNRHHAAMRFRSGWFVAVGAASVWIALKSQAGWAYVQTKRLGKDRLTSLPSWLNQSQLRMNGKSTNAATVLGMTGFDGLESDLPREMPADVCWLDTRQWPDQDSQWSTDYRLALSPVWPRCA